MQRRWRAVTRWMTHSRWPGLGLLLFGVAGFVGVLATTPQEHGQRDIKGWHAAALALIVGMIMGGTLAINYWDGRRALLLDPQARRRSLSEMTTVLQRALATVDAIRTEVEDGERALADLEARIAAQKEAASLTEAESAAVRALLAGEIRRGERRTFLQNAFFFFLGIAVAWFLYGRH